MSDLPFDRDSVLDAAAAMRDKHARVLAATGRVTRDDVGFQVTENTSDLPARVWRNVDGKVCCSCDEFADALDPRFRCRHIMAVKYYLEPPVDPGPAAHPRNAAIPNTATGESHAEIAERTRVARLANEHAADAFEGEPTPVALPDTCPHGRVPFREICHPCERDAEAEADAAAAGVAVENVMQYVNPPAAREVEDFKPTPHKIYFEAIIAALSAPFPDYLVKKTPEGYDYIEWTTACARLDSVYPLWQHKVTTVMQCGGHLAVIASITIEGVTREGMGTGEAITQSGMKTAESDALKRAATKFGIGRYLYERNGDDPFAVESGRRAS